MKADELNHKLWEMRTWQIYTDASCNIFSPYSTGGPIKGTLQAPKPLTHTEPGVIGRDTFVVSKLTRFTYHWHIV